jgi:NAD-dependent deacetylase
VTIVTQNVDGLHEAAARAVAGSRDATRALPLEVHGSIFRVKCVSCTYEKPHREPIRHGSREELPTCPVCGALLRPAVVWFGESLDPTVLSRAFDAARKASLCIVAGTSALVQPAASVPLGTLEGGGKIIEVNPDPTPLTPHSAVALRGASGEVLPRLVEGLAS